MSSSPTTTNQILSEAEDLEIKATVAKIAQYLSDALDVFLEGPPTDEAAHKIVNFVSTVIDSPEDVESLFLEFMAEDPAKGREIISKLGTDATFADLDSAMKNGTIR
jgi:hypothetical protein